MQYLLLIYENQKRFAQDHSKRTLKEYEALTQDPSALHREYEAFGTRYQAAIHLMKALKPTVDATTVRVRDGKRLTEVGPFAETPEQLMGFYLIEAADLDEAISMASQIPSARFGSIEVRPVMTFG